MTQATVYLPTAPSGLEPEVYAFGTLRERFQRARCCQLHHRAKFGILDARAGVVRVASPKEIPAFQRSERCDLPLVDPAMNGCPSRTRTYNPSLNKRSLCH
jgi:hypothetical protein